MSGSGISWAICRSAPRSRQITMPAPHHSVFYRPDALPAARPCQSIEALQFLPTAKLPEHHSHSCINELHPRRIPAALSSRPAEFLQHLSPFLQISGRMVGKSAITIAVQTSTTDTHNDAVACRSHVQNSQQWQQPNSRGRHSACGVTVINACTYQPLSVIHRCNSSP